MYVNKNKQLKKYAASEFRRRMVYIIASELSDRFFHRIDSYRIAKLLKISQGTVKRYLRETEQENPEQEDEETPYINHLELEADVLKSLSDKQRAILILRLNKYHDEDIGKILHLKTESVKRIKRKL